MHRLLRKNPKLTLPALGLVVLLFSIACGAPVATPSPTPVPPAPPASPTALIPTATPTSIIATPTSVPQPVSTPVRALPTATSVVTGKPQYGGTLRFVRVGTTSPDTFDPAYSQVALYANFYSIYDSIFRIDPSGRVIPGLAKAWDFSADGKTLTIQLEKGVKFHDGTPFNAEAVKWNFRRMVDPKENSPRRGEIEPYIERVDVLDESTVRFQLYASFRPLLAQLGSDRPGFMVSPTAVAKYGGGIRGDFGRNPVGTGPFRFAKWVLDREILLERNASYWETGKPYLDAIRFLFSPERATSLAMLRTGEADMVENSAGGEEAALLKKLGFKVPELENAGTYIFHFNASKPPFDNKALRQSIAYAVEREGFLKGFLGGYGKKVWTLITIGWASDPNLKPIDYNLAKAKEKLAEAGYPKGVTIPMGCRTTVDLLRFCEVANAQLKEIGIDLEIKPMAPAGYTAYADAGGYYLKYGLGQVAYSARADPHLLPSYLAYSQGTANLGGYSNPNLDRLIETAAAMFDPAKAKPLYLEIQRIIAEDLPVLAVVTYTSYYPMIPKVQGFVPYLTRFEHLENLWIER